MKEKNYRTLRDALDRLPDYEPGPVAWSNITDRLEGAADRTRASLADRLPTYAPPPQVWNKVSQELDAPRPTVVRRLSVRGWVVAVAAAVALLLLAVPLIRYDAGPDISYAYTQEATPEPVVADWDDDESSFERAREAVQERNEPHLNNLGHELDELTSAREEVKAMLVAYGEDAGMVRQLAEIERERDDVYRRIIIEL